MTRPYLSIIIPAHNEENRLPRTLEQVFTFLAAQPYSAEVWIVENGSTDRTIEIARSFAEKQAGLRILQETQKSRFHLVESLAERLAEICLKEFRLPQITVRVSKPGAIRDARNVGVLITRRKR